MITFSILQLRRNEVGDSIKEIEVKDVYEEEKAFICIYRYLSNENILYTYKALDGRKYFVTI